MKVQPRLQRESQTAARRAGKVRRACAGGMLSLVAATAAWAYQDSAPSGLTGILPTDVPAGLTADDWNVLGPNWETWGQQTSGAVDALYAGEGGLAAQQAALGQLNIKLGTIEKALKDPKYKVIWPQLSSLQGRLSRRVQLAEALLATIDADPAAGRANRVSHAYGRANSAISALQSDLQTVPGGSAWLPYVRAEQISAAAASGDVSPETIELLTKVQQKIDGRDTLSDAAQKEFLGRPQFVELAAGIGDVLAAAKWEPAADQVAKVREEATKLVSAIEAYEADGSDEAATQVNAAYQAIKGLASDGGEQISEVMRQSYFGHNLRLIASEGFMRKSVSDSRVSQGYINEPVSEAWVSGVSCTYTNVSVDLRPNSSVAEFNLQVSGNVNSTTTANAAQAVVYGGSTGNFNATKTVTFDGHTFATSPASVYANASTYANDVDAKVFFLLRPIADMIATNEVAKRKPQSDAYARQKIVDQVSREVNSQTDSRFADATLKLESKTYGPLRELGWYPDSIQTYTTDKELVLRARVMDPQELGAQAPASLPAIPDNGVAIQVHESLLNNGADRLELAGKTLSDEEMKALIESKISTLLGREWHFTKNESTEAPAPAEPAAPADGEESDAEAEAEAAAAGNKYVFDKQDPIRFHIDNGTVTVIMRVGLEREGKDSIPLHIIEVPLGFTVKGDKILMARQGNVRVSPGPGTPRSIPRLNIMRAKVQRSIQDREMEGKIKVEQEGKTINLNITSVEPQDGWVTVLAK